MHRLYLIIKQISYLKTHSHPKPYFCSYLVTWCLWEKGSLQCLWSMSPSDPGGKRSCLGIYSIGVICSLWTPHKKISSVETIEALHKGLPTSCQHKKSLSPTPHHQKRKFVAEHVPLQDNLSPCWRDILRYIEHGEMTRWLVNYSHLQSCFILQFGPCRPKHYTSPITPPPPTHGSEKAWKPRCCGGQGGDAWGAWLVRVASELDNSGASKQLNNLRTKRWLQEPQHPLFPSYDWVLREIGCTWCLLVFHLTEGCGDCMFRWTIDIATHFHQTLLISTILLPILLSYQSFPWQEYQVPIGPKNSW